MRQSLVIAILTSLVVGALAFNVKEKEVRFSNDTIQVGVVVTDLEESIKFYTEVIGMHKVGGFSVSGDFGEKSGLTGGEGFDVTILKLADHPEANQWKLMSFKDAPKTKHDKYIQDGIGMQYITIYVESIAPYLERFKQQKITLLSQPQTTVGDGRQFVLIQDPNGIFIELIET